jgi:hypothetical protein
MTTINETNNKPAVRETLGQKIGRPVLYIGIGFMLCKILDTYLERQKVKRITS